MQNHEAEHYHMLVIWQWTRLSKIWLLKRYLHDMPKTCPGSLVLHMLALLSSHLKWLTTHTTNFISQLPTVTCWIVYDSWSWWYSYTNLKTSHLSIKFHMRKIVAPFTSWVIHNKNPRIFSISRIILRLFLGCVQFRHSIFFQSHHFISANDILPKTTYGTLSF